MKLTYTKEEIQEFRNHAESLGYIHDIKVMIPKTPGEYEEGFGEGCFVLVNDETKKAYDEDEAGTIYEGILDNDSFNYIDLEHGEKIRFEMRGDKNPVALFDDLRKKYRVNLKFYNNMPEYEFLKDLAKKGVIKV